MSFGRIHSHHRDRGRHGSVGSVIVPVAVGSGAGLGLCVVAASLGVAGSGPGGIVVGTGAGVLSGVAAVVTGVVVVRRQARRVVEAVQAAAAGASGTGAASRAPELGAGGRLGTEAVGGVESGADRDLRAETTAGAFGVFAPVAEVVDQVVATLKAEHGFRSVLDTFDGLVIILDEHGLVTYVGDTVREVLGWRPEEVRGTAFAGYVHTADLERFLDFSDATLARGDGPEERLRLRLRGADGSWQVVDWAAARLPGEGLGSLVLSGRDVTHQVAVEQELAHQANHDLLTGLPNRKALLERVAQAVTTASAHRPVAVIMIDLDRFKDVNDSLGHAVGDQLLAQVGPRLRSILRPSDTLARVGGDEFAVVLASADADGAMLVAERLSEQLEDPFLVDGMNLHVEASIGIAVSHRRDRADLATVEALLREADIAMYRAKECGTSVATFDQQRDSGQNRSWLELSGELRHAIGHGQLLLHYQPVVDIVEGRLAGVEALVRWQHPVRGLLPPGDFLPLAERTGLIVPLTNVVLASALSQAARWASQGWPVQVAVNISPRLLTRPELPDSILGMLSEHGVATRLLRLEITESAVLADPEATLPLLVRLREMGIGLSLDDFGTGYSSMTHLRHLPVDEVKVDRAFVQAMTTAPADAVIVRASIGLGHDLGMAVVAEGIENIETLAEVVAAGCSLAQGYYFSRPMAADDLEVWAQQRFGRATVPVLPSQGSAGAAAGVPAWLDDVAALGRGSRVLRP